MKYHHHGDAWMDVETDKRKVYCDVCTEYVQHCMRERAEIEREDPPRYRAPRTQMGYFFPDSDDRCDRCGVVAAHQHGREIKMPILKTPTMKSAHIAWHMTNLYVELEKTQDKNERTKLLKEIALAEKSFADSW